MIYILIDLTGWKRNIKNFHNGSLIKFSVENQRFFKQHFQNLIHDLEKNTLFDVDRLKSAQRVKPLTETQDSKDCLVIKC